MTICDASSAARMLSRAGRRHLEAAISSAAPSNPKTPSAKVIARVPISGIRKNVVASVPRMLPAVEMPYTVPETAPALCFECIRRRIANGEYIPRNVTGNSIMAIAAARLPNLMSSICQAKNCSTGSENIGNSSK